MKAVDTNILIRFLTGDDQQQAQKVYAVFKAAEREKEELFVSLLVMLEMIWVLESAYGISRADILNAIDDLTRMPIFKFERPSVLQQLLRAAPQNTHDLSDLLIAQSAKENGCKTVLTFDKKASKFNLFELVK